MNLKYQNNSIPVTTTHTPTIMKYNFRKLRYAIIIYNCNHYSSIANKQRLDVVMIDDNLTVVSIKRGMHENTIYENKSATSTVLLPLDYFKDLKINTKLTIE